MSSDAGAGKKRGAKKKDGAKVTPMMAQYHAIKKEYPREILFFRMGDFYEMMFDDAVKAAELLGITLTKRGRGTAAEAPMCGVPHHAAENYIAKLIKLGQRVAVCDQVSDPKDAKGIVQREVTRVVTPGTVLDENCMEGKEFQYLAAVLDEGDRLGVAFMEFSTGRFEVTQLDGDQAFLQLMDLLTAKDPAEILVRENDDLSRIDPGFLKERCVTPIDDWYFGKDYARQQLLDHFETLTLDGYGLEPLDLAMRTAGAALSYIYQTQKSKASHLQSLKVLNQSAYMVLDGTTQRNLELTRSIFDGNRSESLLGQIDMCRTVMGSRLLKEWILQPLTDVAEIIARQTYVTSFVTGTIPRTELRTVLGGVPDLDRQVSRLAMGNISPRDLLGIAEALGKIPDIVAQLDEVVPDRYGLEDTLFSELWSMHEHILKSLVPEPPSHMRDGGYMADGVDEELDELRTLRRDSRAILAKIEAREREATGIPKLKVQYNKVFGYYIEVGKVHTAKVPEHYIRKQTLVNSERYITGELKEYESKILGAEEKILAIETRLYSELLGHCQARIQHLRTWSRTVAQVDLHAALAELAVQRNYCRPNISDSDEIEIIDGRHPVVESLSTEPFIANDTFLNNRDDRVLIITGPNMGGKSTYLRQVALITLMAQMGSYVPASKADIGVVDRIFTRVGASDHLARGQSTFMVEMTETANILNHAGPRSLIIMDEIGRGTSTFDGLSIAWSVAEYLHDHNRIGAKTLFATHYHEMTDLERMCEGVTNLHITVKEWKNKIVFLRRIERGAADQSYGIHVAQLAGLPGEVVRRSREILTNLEKNELDTTGKPRLAAAKNKTKNAAPLAETMQLSLFGPEPSPVLDALRALDIDDLTPRKAMDLLFEWKNMV